MRTEIALGALCALAAALAGCASAPVATRNDVADVPPATAATPCIAATRPVARPDLCGHPADVRAFIEDRDACDHFRSEPWPEGDTDEDRQRRRQLVEGVRTSCAGTDRRLAELKRRYAGDARIRALLAGFEDRIED